MDRLDINDLRKSGYNDQQIQQVTQVAKAKGAEVYDSLDQAATAEPNSGFDWTELLPIAGGVVGGVVGGIPGAMVGTGLATTAKQFIDKKEGFDVKEVAGETALSGVGGVLAKGVGKVGSKLLPKIGKSVANAGDDLALKTIRPSKTQLTNFAKQHGEDMTQVIKRYNIVGKNAMQIEDDAIKPLQEQFSNIVKSSKIQIDPADIDKAFYSKVSKLLESPATEDHKLAEKLLLEYDSVMGSIGNKPITGELLNKFRQTFDGKVKSWLADPIEAGKNRLAGSALREVLQESADKAGLQAGGQSFKQAGRELSKLYNVRDLAELQENLGRGNLPVGLLDLLGIGAGGAGMGAAMGAPAGFAGAAAGAATVKMLNSPKAIATFSRLLSSVGGKLEQGVTLPPIVGQGVAQSAVRLPGNLFPEPTPNNNGASNNASAYNAQDNIHMAMDDTTAMGQSQYLTGYAPEELYSAYQKAQMAGDTATAKVLGQWYADEVDYQKTQGSTQEKSAEARKVDAVAKTGSRALQNVKRIISSDPNVLSKQLVPGKWFSREFDAQLYNMVDSYLKLRTGATSNEDEIRGYMERISPKFGDSPEVIQQKLQIFEDSFNEYMGSPTLPANMYAQ